MITTTRSAREPRPTSPRSPSASAFARTYGTRKEPATATIVKTTAMSLPFRAKTSAIAASIAPSPTRSVVESRKAPKTVDFPPTRASAPSRMSRIEPTTKMPAPSQ